VAPSRQQQCLHHTGVLPPHRPDPRAGKFDFLFFADLLAAPVRFGDDITEPLRRGTQGTATLDPSIVAASIGAVTSKLGIAITKSAT
jgi:alkanesulfonate monooxygenase SsuD/methylene tetrahydromethanopterin reductase-like flavin-dependent oxidoreductase (luciferase family)